MIILQHLRLRYLLKPLIRLFCHLVYSFVNEFINFLKWLLFLRLPLNSFDSLVVNLLNSMPQPTRNSFTSSPGAELP